MNDSFPRNAQVFVSQQWFFAMFQELQELERQLEELSDPSKFSEEGCIPVSGYGGFLSHGDTPIYGWFISWKIPPKMDDGLGVPPMT